VLPLCVSYVLFFVSQMCNYDCHAILLCFARNRLMLFTWLSMGLHLFCGSPMMCPSLFHMCYYGVPCFSCVFFLTIFSCVVYLRVSRLLALLSCFSYDLFMVFAHVFLWLHALLL